MRLLAHFRVRLRMSLEELVTWALTLTAIALAVGYQVLRLRDRLMRS